jgi:Na+/H+ antiporter NhaC
MQKILLLCYCVISAVLMRAQNNADSTTNIDSLSITVVDSLTAVNTEPITQVLDTVYIQSLNISVTATQLNLTAQAQNYAGKEYYANIKINGEPLVLKFNNNLASYDIKADYKGRLVSVQHEYKLGKNKNKETQLIHIKKANGINSVQVTILPKWTAIIPPLVAILLALVFREVILSLFIGIFSGVWLINGMPLTPYELLKAFYHTLDTFILQSMMESSHLAVIIFSILIGGLVALISRNGGMAGIVDKLSPLAKSPKSTQFVTWLLGIAIFFDDYANSLIVGNTMRPLCDKHLISREKLSYIVDSTSAPVAAVAFITTWIGAELGYISDALPLLEGMQNPQGAYSIFLNSLSYAFYSFFTIVFMLLIIGTGRDFGAMYRAEHRARTTGKVFADNEDENNHLADDLKELEPVAGAPRRWINGFLPVAVVVFGTLLGLFDTGMTSCYNLLMSKNILLDSNAWGVVWDNIAKLEANPEEVGTFRKLGILIGNADSYSALLWASLSAVAITIILTVVQRIQKLQPALETMIGGFKTMLPALLILIMAWALAATTKELYTAEYLTSSLGDAVSPYWLPALIFILAGAIAFSTGSSWSTMAILYPIAIPLTWTICQNAGLSQADTMPILYNVIATVLSASVFGDHCSPISDTTILSSLASNCKHIDHVNTQMPYALLVGLISIIIGYIATVTGLPFIVNFGIGLFLMWATLMLIGKKVDN